MNKLRIGVSSCLLGEKVRFDGGHKRNPYLLETLGPYVEWVPICPELEAGLGVPREPVRLVGSGARPRVLGVKSGEDFTEVLERFSKRRVALLKSAALSGYLLKKNSPSCGWQRVKVYRKEGGPPAAKGVGIYARALQRAYPSLPIEEEGRLEDPVLRENWIERIFCFQRLQELWKGRWRRADLVEFHARHKLILMAHAPSGLKKLGQLVAQLDRYAPEEISAQYESLFMEVLALPATRARHTNVLQHMQGYVSKLMDSRDREEIIRLIEEYRRGYVPLVVPLTLLGHYVHRYAAAYLQNQFYLYPHPRELALRNHV